MSYKIVRTTVDEKTYRTAKELGLKFNSLIKTGLQVILKQKNLETEVREFLEKNTEAIFEKFEMETDKKIDLIDKTLTEVNKVKQRLLYFEQKHEKLVQKLDELETKIKNLPEIDRLKEEIKQLRLEIISLKEETDKKIEDLKKEVDEVKSRQLENRVSEINRVISSSPAAITISQELLDEIQKGKKHKRKLFHW